MNSLQTYLSFVRFSHSVFALPFALTGALLALHERPLSGRDVAWRVLWIIIAMVAARSAAMGFNRLVDAKYDARNPRTLALGIVFWYSLAKRFTTYTQLFLALAMAVAPVGGWLAAGGPAGALEPWLLATAIGTWVGGFDILYACQDLEFDRAAGLKSIPVRFGVRTSLWLSRLIHVGAVACLAALAAIADLGPLYLVGVALVAVLLVYEQSLVSEDDLSQLKRAFDLNGYVGILYFVATAASLYVRR